MSASNLVQICSKMVDLLPFNWFQNGGRRHVGFWIMRILTVNLSAGSHFQPVSNLMQMRSIMTELWQKMWFSIWRPPPSWILPDTSSEGKCCPGTSFSVSASNLARIRSKMTELWPFNWFQNGGRRHLGFLNDVNFDCKSDCENPFSTYVSNSVQMRAIMEELWPKMWLSIWRPPPSWILLDTSSEGKVGPGTLFSVSVSNLVRIRSKMAELWPFNWFQNDGRRHLEFTPGVYFYRAMLAQSAVMRQ